MADSLFLGIGCGWEGASFPFGLEALRVGSIPTLPSMR